MNILNDGFKILNISIKPFDNGGTGFYIELKFTVEPTCDNYERFLKHTSQEFDKEFYLDFIDNVFILNEAVTYTPTTLGVLQELKDLKEDRISDNYRFITSTYLYRCIQTLANFWD